MHITAEDIIVETIGADGRPVAAGESGEIVVTHLASRDFPFIRYRTGDFGVLDTQLCACGRGLPLLREIQGRSTDFVVAADGTLMHGLALIYVIRDLPGIAAFKIIQETTALTRVQIVPGEGFGPATSANDRAGTARPPWRKCGSRRGRSRGHRGRGIGKVSLRREQGNHLKPSAPAPRRKRRL